MYFLWARNIRILFSPFSFYASLTVIKWQHFLRKWQTLETNDHHLFCKEDFRDTAAWDNVGINCWFTRLIFWGKFGVGKTDFTEIRLSLFFEYFKINQIFTKRWWYKDFTSWYFLTVMLLKNNNEEVMYIIKKNWCQIVAFFQV